MIKCERLQIHSAVNRKWLFASGWYKQLTTNHQQQLREQRKCYRVILYKRQGNKDMSVNSESSSVKRPLAAKIARWLSPLPGSKVRSPELLLIISAVIVGGITGLAAVFFIWLLKQMGTLTIWASDQAGVVGMLLYMGLAGLIVGFMINRWAREAKGHGVPEVMEAIALRGGRIRGVVAAVKVTASAITIGAGGSAGREGPIVQVGSALGSVMAQKLKFSEERIRTLVACGAAAGIAATFNAPIAGAIFALEVILGRFTVRYFGAVVLSAVSAAVVGQYFQGSHPALQIPAYPLHSFGEIPIYILLGVLASLVAVLFIRALYKTEEIFDNWAIPLMFKTAIGMMLTGAVALFFADRAVLGPGLELIEEIIVEDVSLTLPMMGALLLLKLVATSFTLGSGNSGGVFAPALFMGAILGGMVGRAAHTFWPGIAVNPGAYAIVGMAAVFAGAARAPITAVLIVFEMSNDYRLILPLMLATVLATLLAEAMFTESIYTLKLKLKGITLNRGRDEDILSSVRVADVMRMEHITVSVNDPLPRLVEVLARTHYHGLPVLDENGNLAGIVTVSDLDRVREGSVDMTTLTVGDVCTPREKLLTAYPDETIGDVLQRMSRRGLGQMPVVPFGEQNKLLGMISRETIVRAYNVALVERAEVQHRTKRLQLDNVDGTEFVVIELGPEDTAVGKTIQELAPNLPHECVLVSIRRDGRLLIPHGDTLLQPGDEITAFIDSDDEAALNSCLHGRKVPASE